MAQNWYISYRFYDPTVSKPKLIIIKGMNQLKDLAQRRQITARLIEEELYQLEVMGYNPITNRFTMPERLEYEVDPSTPFVDALKKALDKIKKSKSTNRDLKSIFEGTKKAAIVLRFNQLKISDIRRKHIKAIIDRVQKMYGTDSPHRYNKYRTYLRILFTELVEMEAVAFNPVTDLRKRKTSLKLREILTDEERKAVDEGTKHLVEFNRFIHIFFHAGARLTEIMQVKGNQVDLENQRWKANIKKGKGETWKTIKDIALPYWKEALKDCGSNQYLFSKFLKPGDKPINTDQITRRWKKYVKDPKTGLGINKDFYALKHANTDETDELVGIKVAAAQNDHTTPVVTMKHYAVNASKRMHEKMKAVNNPFSK